jgi:hypothetical protein
VLAATFGRALVGGGWREIKAVWGFDEAGEELEEAQEKKAK